VIRTLAGQAVKTKSALEKCCWGGSRGSGGGGRRLHKVKTGPLKHTVGTPTARGRFSRRNDTKGLACQGVLTRDQTTHSVEKRHGHIFDREGNSKESSLGGGDSELITKGKKTHSYWGKVDVWRVGGQGVTRRIGRPNMGRQETPTLLFDNPLAEHWKSRPVREKAEISRLRTKGEVNESGLRGTNNGKGSQIPG